MNPPIVGVPFALLEFQPADQRRADQEGDDERRHHRPAGAEGDVAKHVEELEVLRERNEKVIEHERP
jgi:hypothetical protein